ncbi:methyl-accepting chemotaxis protein [Vibrio sp. TRT 17S01]|uniref:methyl-accepting chemotaxis protein n=1 Tax=Vibrio sp. TRT 17S01 TaxID=3418505 RepID=UPI003CECB00B
MKKVLQYFPLYVVVSVLAGIPILISISMAIELVSNQKNAVVHAEKDKESVHLILLYDNLAHNLAVERGLTAGVLGSKGNSKQVEKLQNHRSTVNTHVNAFLDFQPVYLENQFVHALRKDVTAQLNQLNKVRNEVDTLRPNLSPFAYYSNLNQLAIDNATTLSSLLNNPQVSSLGSGLVSVITMKERAGQVRGALNGAFARQSSTLGQYTSVEGYIKSGEYGQRMAFITLPNQYAVVLNRAIKSDTWQKVVEIQSSYLSQKATLSSLVGPESSQWFGMATERIKSLNNVRNEIQKEMTALASNQANNAIFMQTMLFTTTTLLALILVGSLYVCVKNLKLRVGLLTENLATMSNQRDLSISLENHGKDEVSLISKSVNGLTQNLKKLLSDITRANDHSSDRLEQIVQNATNLGESSQSTTAKCDNIATAMTELAQSSHDIATSSERSLEETKQMTEKVLACQAQSKESFHVVEALVDQIEQTQSCMQQLEEDASSVSKIVDTINGISEQTNLLALNAAIEAARAGEHGRGFAVVSSEVRDLAQRSKEATESIGQLLQNMTSNTQTAVENMNKSRTATDSTHSSVSQVAESVGELESIIELVNAHITSIANATIEQSKASEAVDKDIDVLAEIAQNTGELANNLNNVVHNYRTEAKHVQNQLQTFKLA